MDTSFVKHVVNVAAAFQKMFLLLEKQGIEFKGSENQGASHAFSEGLELGDGDELIITCYFGLAESGAHLKFRSDDGIESELYIAHRPEDSGHFKVGYDDEKTEVPELKAIADKYNLEPGVEAVMIQDYAFRLVADLAEYFKTQRPAA